MTFRLDQIGGNAQQVGRCHRVGLGQADRTEHTGPPKPLGHQRLRLGVELRAFGIARNRPDPLDPHPVIAFDGQRPESQARPLIDADCCAQRRIGMIRHQILTRHGGLGIAKRPPTLDADRDSRLHQAAFRNLTVGKAARQHGLAGQRGYLGAAEGELSAGIDGHGNSTDGGRGIQRRNTRSFLPVNQHMNHRAVIALGI